jgi:hypothetical protein
LSALLCLAAIICFVFGLMSRRSLHHVWNRRTDGAPQLRPGAPVCISDMAEPAAHQERRRAGEPQRALEHAGANHRHKPA